MIVIHQVSCVKRRFPFRYGLLRVTYGWRVYIIEGLFSLRACLRVVMTSRPHGTMGKQVPRVNVVTGQEQRFEEERMS